MLQLYQQIICRNDEISLPKIFGMNQQQQQLYYSPQHQYHQPRMAQLPYNSCQKSQLQQMQVLNPQTPQKIINLQANVFIKNLNPNLTARDLERSFSQYGVVISARVNCDQSGKNLGYGYVQFSTTQEALNCIQYANNKLYEGQVIQVMQFQDKQTRLETNARNNLYIKNLPLYMPLEELKPKLYQLFSRYGRILSSCVKIDPQLRRPFAFICFETAMEAEQAMAGVNNTDPFKTGYKLFINWAEKIDERKKRLGELHTIAFGYNASPSSQVLLQYASSQYERKKKILNQQIFQKK